MQGFSCFSSRHKVDDYSKGREVFYLFRNRAQRKKRGVTRNSTIVAIKTHNHLSEGDMLVRIPPPKTTGKISQLLD